MSERRKQVEKLERASMECSLAWKELSEADPDVKRVLEKFPVVMNFSTVRDDYDIAHMFTFLMHLLFKTMGNDDIRKGISEARKIVESFVGVRRSGQASEIAIAMNEALNKTIGFILEQLESGAPREQIAEALKKFAENK